jgi:DNA-binding NarL/FixJ family response regulator
MPLGGGSVGVLGSTLCLFRGARWPVRELPPRYCRCRKLPHDWDACVDALKLSPRQTAIVRLILRGKKDKEIAAEMGLSKYTVRTFLKRIFDRFDVSDRAALVLCVLANHRASCAHAECPHKKSPLS